MTKAISRSFSLFLAVLLVNLTLPSTLLAQDFDTKAEQAILVEENSGSVLYEKNADDLVPPASLAKLMTMEVVFNALKEGRLSLDDKFSVSENAWREGGASSGGSTMFAQLNSQISVEDLIQGVIVQSGNDACIILAEGMAGTEATFARLMTERARELGMTMSVFTNSTGLPDPDQKVTMRELSLLAMHIHQTYPEYFSYYSQPEFTWNGITQSNRNPVLGMNLGGDGMKTGYTEDSGYALVGTAEQSGKRLVAAMSGMESSRERAEEGRRLINWGMRAFQSTAIYEADEIVAEARVFGGETATVPLKAKGAVSVLTPLTNQESLKARVVYQGPIPAPVAEGDRVATLRVWVGEKLTQETPLYAAQAVGTGGIHRKALDSLQELFFFWL